MDAAVAVIIAVIALGLILSGRMHHTIAAMLGAVVMLVAGIAFAFYGEAQALESVEFDALALLLGMMILVSILEPTGFFQYVAVKAGQLSKGDPWRLMLLLGGGTAFVSLFFTNVTTVVVVGPITILITELLGLNPVPYLMAQAILSDTSGVGTSVGDPASVLIASASGNSFTDFLTHSLPLVLMVAIVTLIMLRILFAKELSQQPTDPEVVKGLDAEGALQDRVTVRKVMVVLGIAITLFIFQSTLNISSGFIAIGAAAFALTWARPDLREVLQRVDFSVLLFFTGLFILVGGLEHAGVFKPLTAVLAELGQSAPILLGVAIIWVVAVLSALIDNVAVTIAMIALIKGLAASGVDITALWWAVVFGAGFGGSATSIGSSANIVIVSLSERTRTPITPKQWSRRGLPIAFVNCVVGSILFVIAFSWLSR